MSILRTVRPPRPAFARQIDKPTHAPALVQLIVAPDSRGALRVLTELQSSTADRATPGLLHVTGSSSGALASALLAHAPVGTHISSARGSRNVASIGPGASRGWARLELPADNFRLDAVYLPAQFACVTVAVLPGATDADGPAELWLKVVHPHTALRVRASGRRSELLAEVLATTRATYVLPLKPAVPSARRVVAVTDDVVAAQLIRLAWHRLAADPHEPETLSPWEDAVVQAATQLGLGPARGDQLTLRIQDAHGLAGSLPDHIAELLSCSVQHTDEERAVE